MRLLIDADALSKLAHWDLLADLADLTGIPVQQTATLSSLRHRAAKCCRNADGKLFRDTAAAKRAVEYTQQLPALPEPDSEFISRLQSIPGIDPGEAVLLAILKRNADTVLLTGDKRALGALTKSLEPSTMSALDDRVVIVEQIVLAYLQSKGLEWLRARVCPYRTLDIAIGIVMGSNCDAPFASVEQGMRSYISDLRSNSGALLRTKPPFS